jgi:glycosyltransferase involved in cell wall biosynthesis
MKQLRLSVIIPCYNHGEYILEAIESVKKSKERNYEIIIINDGSDDKKTIKILKNLKKQGYNVIHQKNKGPSSARNNGIKIAKGKYLLLLDSDDKINPNLIKNGIEILDKNLEVGVVYGDYKYFGDKNDVMLLSEFDINSILLSNYIPVCTVIRKKVWEDVGGFDVNLNKLIWEDWVFWIDIYKAGWKFYHIPGVLFYYRKNNYNSRDNLSQDKKVRKELFDYIGKRYGDYIYDKYRRIYPELSVLNNELIQNADYISNLHYDLDNIKNSLIWTTVQKFDGLREFFIPEKSFMGQFYKKFIKSLGNFFNSGILNHTSEKNYNMSVINTKFNKLDIEKNLENFDYKPKISIIMPVYNVDSKWLNLAINSVINQFYDNWELCIADDASVNEGTLDYLKNLDDDRIKIKFLKNNLGISGASNEASRLATGDYIALLDHDDTLSPDALYEVVKSINKLDPDLIYSDEDKLTLQGFYVEPFYKPDFSMERFYSSNYLCHLSVFRKSLFDNVGGFRKAFDGSQDYDLLLRSAEKTSKIHHISKVLYHWRKIPGSCSVDHRSKPYAYLAGKKALEESLKRRGISGKVLFGKGPGNYNVVIEA